MEHNPIKIADVVSTEYSDFLDYCTTSGKSFTWELTNVDYVAFRTSSGHSRDYINTIRNLIENSAIISESTSKKIVAEGIIPVSDEDNEVTNEEYNGNDVFSDTSVEIENEVLDLAFNNVETDDSQNESVNIDDANDSFENALKNDTLLNVDLTLAENWGLEPANFKDISIDELDLSMRASNCLRRVKYFYINDIISQTLNGLRSIRNMGTKTVEEILSKTKAFTMQRPNGDQPIDVGFKVLIPAGNECIKASVEAMLLDEDYDIELLSETQLEIFKKAGEAVDQIGKEICLYTYLNPQYSAVVMNSLWKFSLPYVRYRQALNDSFCYIEKLNNSIKINKIVPFIQAYTATTGLNLNWLLSKCTQTATISDLPFLLDKISADENAENYIYEINKFLQWINFDISELVQTLYRKIEALYTGRERTFEVFTMRHNGKTLEEIGRYIGVTRERVRQIESRACRIVWGAYKRCRYDLILMIYALQNGNPIIHFNDLKDVVGDLALILWPCFKSFSENEESYYYSEYFDAILIKVDKMFNENEFDHLLYSVETLPFIISVDEAIVELKKIANENNVPFEILKSFFELNNKLTGVFYHRGTITVVFMCDYVLKNRFQSGFKVNDTFEADRFRQYIAEFFGDKSSNMTNRAIDAKVGEIGCLCDRGKYIHPDYLNVEQSVIDAINDYVSSSTRSVIPFNEVYEDLQDIFAGTQITNRYALQGAIKKYGCKFKTSRDFIRKNSSISFVDEIESFVEERGIVHKSEIFAEFSSISDVTLGQVVSRSANLFNIDNGNYIHSSVFDIQPEDYGELRQYLTKACANIPANIRAIHEEVRTQFSDFMYRNDFEDKNKLFAALNYMFRSEFVFSRPYIAKLGAGEVTNKSVLLQHIEEYDSIDAEELVDICDEYNINYVSTSHLFQWLLPEYIRINSYTLMKREYTGVTDEVIVKTIELIDEMLETKDYVVGAKINDFIWFPQIDVEWNEFLLESIIIQSGKINIVNITGNPLKHPNAIYVSEKYKNDTYDSLLIKILSDEVKKDSFTSKVEMREWLLEEKFIEGKLPKFLESSKYFYIDNTGVHIQRKDEI